MERLPTDILVEIFAYLPQSAIINLPFHYTPMGLTEADCKRRFQQLDGSIEKANLHQMARAAANPYLGPCVTKIYLMTYCSTVCRLEPFRSLCWKRHQDLMHDYLKGTATMPPNSDASDTSEFPELLEKQCPFCCYKSFDTQNPLVISRLCEQRRFENSHQALRLLLSIIDRFPNLNTIRIGLARFEDSDYSAWLSSYATSVVEKNPSNHSPNLMLSAFIRAVSISRTQSYFFVLGEHPGPDHDSRIDLCLELGGLLLEFDYNEEEFWSSPQMIASDNSRRAAFQTGRPYQNTVHLPIQQ